MNFSNISEDVLPNRKKRIQKRNLEQTVQFQKDAALAVSTNWRNTMVAFLLTASGLGKTFPGLAVIQYYENQETNPYWYCVPQETEQYWQTFRKL